VTNKAQDHIPPAVAAPAVELLGIHHIDYVVRDLDRAIAQYRRLFDIEFGSREVLENRGVALARVRLGDIWLVLVQPIRPDSPVQRFLDEHGEGFFHIAYRVKDVAAGATALKAQGVHLLNEEPRRGVEGWKLVDLDIAETFGVMTQLVEPA
jgi:methylmalonyl-CoA/ethylmalonyl-CoA epimerase